MQNLEIQTEDLGEIDLINHHKIPVPKKVMSTGNNCYHNGQYRFTNSVRSGLSSNSQQLNNYSLNQIGLLPQNLNYETEIGSNRNLKSSSQRKRVLFSHTMNLNDKNNNQNNINNRNNNNMYNEYNNSLQQQEQQEQQFEKQVESQQIYGQNNSPQKYQSQIKNQLPGYLKPIKNFKNYLEKQQQVQEKLLKKQNFYHINSINYKDYKYKKLPPKMDKFSSFQEENNINNPQTEKNASTSQTNNFFGGSKSNRSNNPQSCRNMVIQKPTKKSNLQKQYQYHPIPIEYVYAKKLQEKEQNKIVDKSSSFLGKQNQENQDNNQNLKNQNGQQQQKEDQEEQIQGLKFKKIHHKSQQNSQNKSFYKFMQSQQQGSEQQFSIRSNSIGSSPLYKKASKFYKNNDEIQNKNDEKKKNSQVSLRIGEFKTKIDEFYTQFQKDRNDFQMGLQNKRRPKTQQNIVSFQQIYSKKSQDFDGNTPGSNTRVCYTSHTNKRKRMSQGTISNNYFYHPQQSSQQHQQSEMQSTFQQNNLNPYNNEQQQYIVKINNKNQIFEYGKMPKSQKLSLIMDSYNKLEQLSTEFKHKYINLEQRANEDMKQNKQMMARGDQIYLIIFIKNCQILNGSQDQVILRILRGFDICIQNLDNMTDVMGIEQLLSFYRILIHRDSALSDTIKFLEKFFRLDLEQIDQQEFKEVVELICGNCNLSNFQTEQMVRKFENSGIIIQSQKDISHLYVDKDRFIDCFKYNEINIYDIIDIICQIIPGFMVNE